ncbi:mechanosensitive ion channel family protein [Dehalococcoidia bacterium]|nr:mechanosensitive ion channel family protein [Dehalococcoidia bacterium]
MDQELFAGITVADSAYSGTIFLLGVLLALIIRFTGKRSKTKLRRKNRASLGAQILDDVEEPAFFWIIAISLYLGMLELPPLADVLGVARVGLMVASIAALVYSVIRVQGHALEWYADRPGRTTAQAKLFNSLLPMAKRLANIVTLAMGILVIMDQLGIAIAPMIAGLGIGGLAVALALQGTLTNFFAGLNILTDGSIRIGDLLELDGGTSGFVDQIGWRTTRIRMLDDNTVIIPNSKLADTIATNYNYPQDEMSLYVQVGVSYFSDLHHVEQVTVEVAKKIMQEIPGAVKEYQPSIWYTGFGDSNINFWVVLRALGYMESWVVKHNFIQALFSRYNEEGIEISFPARNVFLKGPTPQSFPVDTPQ